MAKALRATCDPALGTLMAEHVLRDCLPPPGAKVAGFISLPGEIDTAPLLHSLAARGYDICLPVTLQKGEALTFRSWRPGDVLHTGRFGTQHTIGAECEPDFILVPLLAFDDELNRLGYGGGYYDRTFAKLPNAFRLGCAFAAQRMAKVPVGPHDIKLNAVATE